MGKWRSTGAKYRPKMLRPGDHGMRSQTSLIWRCQRPGAAVRRGRSLEQAPGRDHRGLSGGLPGPEVWVRSTPSPFHGPAGSPQAQAEAPTSRSSGQHHRQHLRARRTHLPRVPQLPGFPGRQRPSPDAPRPPPPLPPGTHSQRTLGEHPASLRLLGKYFRSRVGPAGIPEKKAARDDPAPSPPYLQGPFRLLRFWERPSWAPLPRGGLLAIWSDQRVWVWCLYMRLELFRYQSLERQDPHSPTPNLMGRGLGGASSFLVPVVRNFGLRQHKVAWTCSHPAPWPQRRHGTSIPDLQPSGWMLRCPQTPGQRFQARPPRFTAGHSFPLGGLSGGAVNSHQHLGWGWTQVPLRLDRCQNYIWH